MRVRRARYYDAKVGRWISEDPIGFAAGDYNLSRYVGNSPTNATDPSGLDKLEFVIEAYIPTKYVDSPAGQFEGDGILRGEATPNWDKTIGVADNDYRMRLHITLDTETNKSRYETDAGMTRKVDPKTKKVIKEREAQEGKEMLHEAFPYRKKNRTTTCTTFKHAEQVSIP